MVYKRIIPCLDVQGGQVVKGVNFINIQAIEDPVKLAKQYCEQGADELVFLDISATNEGRETMLDVVEAVAKAVAIPFTVGGGIASLDDMRKVIGRGADKVAVNSAAVKRPELIKEGAAVFGRQCLVLAVDTKRVDGVERVFIGGGKVATGIDALAWIQQGVALGAGEILLTSMDRDGTKEGYDLSFLKQVAETVNVPVIASGGCGCPQDVVDLLLGTGVSAALVASMFHYGDETPNTLKEKLKQKGVRVRYETEF